MRTTIDIDDKLMAAAMKCSGFPTKKGTVEEALRILVEALPARPKKITESARPK
jgi:Arc/MetJ family transcription regulator